MLPDDPATGLVYASQSSAASGATSACTLVSQILKDSHLAAEPDIRPGSLMAWAGRRIFDETGDIALVARRMGCISLDTAANRIGWQWHG